jgi:hypothetical protein
MKGKRPGAEIVLSLRALTHTKGRWSQFWSTGQTHTKVHISIRANFQPLIAKILISKTLLRKMATTLV